MAAIVAASAAFGFSVSLISGTDPASGALGGFLIALFIATLENLLQGPWAATVRHWPPAVLLLLRTALYGLAFVVMVHVATALVFRSWEPILHPTRLVSNATLVLSFCFAFAVNFAVMLARLLGSRVAVSLITGRYRRPRKEERIVLFMDLRGSTKLAEQLGDERFHGFLNQVFSDVADPILEAGGEIYRYVGDEIIITWPVEGSPRDARCVECVFAIEEVLAGSRERYLSDYGAEPRLRGALHVGPLIVGEMGDLKREIVLLGDTMNTAARIENACRMFDKDVIASAPTLRLFAPPAGVHAQSLGVVALRGKETELELFALTRG
jgi:adenylate cyclase